MAAKKTTHGGARPGAGRPPKYDASAVCLLLKLPGDLAARLAEAATKLGISRTEAIQKAIRAWLKR